MELNEQQLTQIKSFGMVKTPASQICKLLGFIGEMREIFLTEFNDEESQIRIFYEEGLAIAEYNIDVKLTKISETGDIPTIQELNTRQYRSKINAMKKELFGI